MSARLATLPRPRLKRPASSITRLYNLITSFALINSINFQQLNLVVSFVLRFVSFCSLGVVL